MLSNLHRKEQLTCIDTALIFKVVFHCFNCKKFTYYECPYNDYILILFVSLIDRKRKKKKGNAMDVFIFMISLQTAHEEMKTFLLLLFAIGDISPT